MFSVLRLASVLATAALAGAVACSSTSSFDPSGTAGTSTGGNGGGAPSTDGDACARYCDSIMRVCTGEFQQYATESTCRAVCETLPEGNPGDLLTNSVWCRIGRVEAAEMLGEQADACPTAGPVGGGVCGEDCDGWCSILLAACPMGEDLVTGQVYTNPVDCRRVCQEDIPRLLDEETGEPVPFSNSIQTGNHLECRVWHASAAATADAFIHCPHSLGAAPCVEEGAEGHHGAHGVENGVEHGEVGDAVGPSSSGS